MPAMFKTTMFLVVVALAASATAQEAPTPSTGAFELVLSEANRLASQGKYPDASIVYRKILDEGDESAAYYQEAKYQMGVVLYQLKLYVSAFGNFDNICDSGTSHARYKDTLPWLVKIHRELPGETNSLLRMANFPVEMYPENLAEEINFYVGQHHYYQGNLTAALQSLGRVGTSNPNLYTKAVYLKGVVHVRRNEAGPASDAFKEVLRFVRENKKTVVESGRMTDLAMTALARIFYSTGQFDTALRYYDQLPQDSDTWLESLFEKSWAYYRLGNFGRALGNLMTVNSPYFEQEYYPEAHVLRAVIYFKNCYYDEALATIDPFYKEYYDVMKELESSLAGRPDPNDFYNYIAAVSVKGGAYSAKVKKIFNAALADKKLRRLFGFVVQISKEIQLVEEMKKTPVGKAMAEFLIPDLVAYRFLTTGEAGKLARERLGLVQKDLKGLLAQALKVRFESLNAQKGKLGESLRKEQILAKKGSLDRTVDAEHILWPYDGETWFDELGSYHVSLMSRCGTAD